MKMWHVLMISSLWIGMGQTMAAEKTVDIYSLNTDVSTKGLGEKIGTITFEDSSKGLVIKPSLKNIAVGEHGFHIHENPSCEAAEKNKTWVPGLAAGDHFDPSHTGKHLGPHKDGHLGDLPVLVVDQDGKIYDLVAPRLTLKDIENHSIMIHAGGDNYSDNPPMGGGGARIACGVIE